MPHERNANIEINCIMENNQQQILSEIKSLMATVRLHLEQLDAKMAQFQQMCEPQEYDVDPIEMDFDVFPSMVSDDLPFSLDVQSVVPDEPADEPLPVVPADSELPAPVQPEPEENEPEPPASVQPEPVLSEPVPVQPEPEEVESERPAPVQPEPESKTASVAVIDAMATHHAWRNDMPGSAVKDVRAAIALVDRALFINTLFNEDAMAFLEALNYINQAGDLDTVVNYLAETYPQWDFDSDVVYRFMMAVRRKVN